MAYYSALEVEVETIFEGSSRIYHPFWLPISLDHLQSTSILKFNHSRTNIGILESMGYKQKSWDGLLLFSGLTLGLASLSTCSPWTSGEVPNAPILVRARKVLRRNPTIKLLDWISSSASHYLATRCCNGKIAFEYYIHHKAPSMILSRKFLSRSS